MRTAKQAFSPGAMSWICPAHGRRRRRSVICWRAGFLSTTALKNTRKKETREKSNALFVSVKRRLLIVADAWCSSALSCLSHVKGARAAHEQMASAAPRARHAPETAFSETPLSIHTWQRPRPRPP